MKKIWKSLITIVSCLTLVCEGQVTGVFAMETAEEKHDGIIAEISNEINDQNGQITDAVDDIEDEPVSIISGEDCNNVYEYDAVENSFVCQNEENIEPNTEITSDDVIIEGTVAVGLTAEGKTKNTIIIPEGVKEIKYEAFKGENFESVIIPESAYRINYRAFEGCKNLKSVDIRSKNLQGTNYGGSFENCSISSLKFSSTISRLPMHLFEKAGFSDLDLVIPENIEEINEYCFSGAKGIKSITFAGNKITHIGPSAFSNLTDIESIVIPESVTQIDSGAFNGCISLKSVDIRSTVLDDTIFTDKTGVFKNCSINDLKLSDSLTYLPISMFSEAGFSDYDFV